MMTDPGASRRSSRCCCPRSAFLLLAVVAPLRRLGRPAACVSIAVCRRRRSAAAIGGVARPRRAARSHGCVWEWLPVATADRSPTVGVLADARLDADAVLVTLVALLVQLYSLGYLHDEPPAGARPLLHLPVALRVLDDGRWCSRRTSCSSSSAGSWSASARTC